MSDTVIRVENLSKKYIIGHQQAESGNYKALRDVIVDQVKSLSTLIQNKKIKIHNTSEEFWALKDVFFEIKQGDRVGIIGRNGAGKSTLLKVLSRITEPTNGRISIKGRIVSLLEVGTGFHPELTGRENIYLNGAILGMSRTEIQHKFDEIVAFAEIEKFLDTPVKRYSSGMYVRLAFAVAAHLESEILIVDEVLAVGDAQFQKKCLGKMGKVAQDGRTVLFVSHNMAAINSLCSKGIVLNQGKIIFNGSTQDSIATYELRSFQGQTWTRLLTQANKSVLLITGVNLILKGKQPNLILEMEITLKSIGNHKPAFLAVDILDSTGITLMQALPQLEGFLHDTEQQHLVNISIYLPPLIPGQYLVSIWVGSHNTNTLDEVKEIILFEVYESPTLGRSFEHTKDHGYLVPKSNLNSVSNTTTRSSKWQE